MGFLNGEILLDSQNSCYYAGQQVVGTLTFTKNSAKSMRGIYVQFKGLAKTEWHANKSTHIGKEVYFRERVYLMGGPSSSTELEPGSYKLPFQFVIPPHVPSSFEGTFGWIRYKVKAGIDLALQIDPVLKRQIRVFRQVNLNLLPISRVPLSVNIADTYWDSAGEVLASARLPYSAYCPGSNLFIALHCTNNTTVDMDEIKVSLKKGIIFRTNDNGCATVEKREAREKLAVVSRGPVPAASCANWNVELIIPQHIDTSNLENCSIIDLDYVLKVKLVAEGLHKGGSEERKIIIGTIPLQDLRESGVPETPPPPYSSVPPLPQHDTPMPYNM